MIQTENTPNPNAVKFLSDQNFSEVGAREFQKKDIKEIKNNLIKNLLNFEGVELVLVSKKFISVKKKDDVNWNTLKPSIISTINDYIEKNKEPILTTKDQNSSDEKENDNLVVEEIKKVLDSKIRPAVEKDGGDIKFVSFNEGTVKVELRGSCSGCPSSIVTLKNGVQNLLKHYVKEVKNVEAS
tara:strand:- start:16412 stop:16963 length:552 start_codon:yes stop_codon:yes gene_type:complete